MSTQPTLDLNALNVNRNFAARDYWKERLYGFYFRDYFYNSPAGDDQLQQRRYAACVVRGSTELKNNLDRLAPSYKARHVVLLSALGILIQKYMRIDDVCVFTPVYSSESTQDDRRYMVAVRMAAPVDGNFKNFLSVVKSDLVRDLEYGRYSIERMLNEDDTGYRSAYTVGLSVKELAPSPDPAQFKAGIAFNFSVGDQFTMSISYDVTRFDADYIQYLAELYLSLLEKLLSDPEMDITAVDLLDEEEKHTLLYLNNATAASYPAEETVVSLFDKWALRAGDLVAVRCGEHTLSYAELKRRSEQLAANLRDKWDLKRGEAVCMLVDRDMDLLVVILGIMKAGGVYVPLDPNYPVGRVQDIIKESGCRLVITNGRYENHTTGLDISVVDVNNLLIADEINIRSLPRVQSSDLAYIIYTSGSTGKPKGVMISHGSLLNYIWWAAGYYAKGEPCGFALHTSVSFDLTVTSLFLPLITGGEIVVYEGEEKLEKIISNERISVIKLTPSHLRVLASLEEGPKDGRTRKLIVGGEQLTRELAMKIHDLFEGRVEIYNEYGPTETTVGCMIYRFDVQDQMPVVPIGVPIANTQVYLLDGELKPVVTGAEGELYVSGAGVGEGYWKNEELTAERFIENPFEKGLRMYRTGDVGVWLPDGRMMFRGRSDEQVKIRGFRIEPGEIERQLSAHEMIRSAVVVARERGGEQYLVAYYLSDQELENAVLRSWLGERLPEYMVPVHYVRLESIPLTVNGKLDKKALPEPELTSAKEYVAPTNEIEKKLVQIWSEVLKTDPGEISTTQSFFEFGINSLMAIVLANKIFKQLNVKISLREFFKHEDLRDLARFIETADKSVYSSIKKVLSKPYYKVSSAQRRLYFIHESNKTSIAYNMLQVVQLEGTLDIGQMQDTFRQLVARHESLRTYFEIIRGELMQKIADKVDFKVEIFKAAEEEVPSIIKKFRKPFALNVAPLIRVGIIELDAQRHILVADMHHITADGISQSVLIKDFMALYNGQSLPTLRLQYKDYAEWQQSAEEQEQLDTHKKFWLSEFAVLPPVLDLPADNIRPLVKDYHGSLMRFALSEEDTVKLKSIADAQGATLFMLLLSIYNILLSKLGNKDDITVGTSTAGRHHSDLEKIIGVFVNMLTIRNHVKSDLTFAEFLATVRSKTLACFEHQSYQYDQLVEELKMERDMSRNPLFDVMFDFHNFEGTELKIPGLVIKPYPTVSSIAKFDLTLSAYEQEGCLHFNLEYATSLFSGATIERFIDYFRKVVSAVLSDINTRLSSIDILGEEERTLLVEQYNVTAAPYPVEETVVSLFDKWALQEGARVAVRCGESTLSYAELKRRSERLATNLRDKWNLQRGEAVCMLVDRDMDLLTVILGIMKAGGVYVPLDPNYPVGRVQDIIKESGCRLVISNGRYESHTAGLDVTVVDVDSLLIAGRAGKGPVAAPVSSDLAYIIYTSGSTGKPKGVMISHGSLLNYIWWAAGYYVKGEASGFALHTSVSFDLTVTSLFTPLITGGEIVVFEGDEKGGGLLEKIIADERISVIKLTPSHLRVLASLEEGPKDGKTRKLIVGGEQLTRELALKIHDLFEGRVEIYNEYGPTETTVGCMIYRFDVQDQMSVVPIGVPIANTQVYLLDGELKPVVNGAEGELYVSGAGVGEGYWKNEELTAERFMENPFKKGLRMYKTGDVGVWLPDGRMMFRGRSDEQVKIRGFRIEPGEIERQLSDHEMIRSVVVVARERGGEQYLVAYYLSDEELENAALRTWLGERLPEYMVPGHYVRLDSIPLTVNGKLDKKALPDPEVASAKEYVAPTNEIEKKLVQIWAGVLNMDPNTIGITQSFFELGGHSLRAIELISKMHKQLSVQVSLDDVFEHSDIASLAKIIAESTTNEYLSIPKAPQKDYYALSYTQKGMFFLNELDKQSLAYNMPRVIKLEGALNKDKIAAVFNKLIERYEVFRTGFEIVNETPVQKIYDTVDFHIEEHQFHQDEVASITQKLIRPFDLAKPPLLRVGVVEVNENENFLMVDTHHIIMDGTSNGILIKTFVDLYNDKELPELHLQYKDYTEWLQSPARQQHILKEKEFWSREFSGGLPATELPTDFSRPLIKSHEGSTIDFNISSAEVRKIRSIEESEECTLFMVLIASYYVLLAKITGQEDLVIGASVSSRKHEDLKEMLGLFLDSIPMRNYPKKNLSFRRFLKDVKAKTFSCFENQSYEYEQLANELSEYRNATHNALFDVMFAVQNYERAAFKLPGLNFTTYSRKGFESKFDLTLTATEQGDQIGFSLEYCSKLFKRETVERFIDYFRNILSVILSDIDVKIGDIEIISEEEKHRILHEFNAEPVPYTGEKNIIDLFQDAVNRFSDATAILFRDESLTYQQLNHRVNQLSHYLSTVKKLRPKEAVAIHFERSPEMIIALLAVLKSGAFYIPVEPHFPVDRITAMIKESNVRLVLTNIGDNDLNESGVEIVDVITESEMISNCPHTDPDIPVNADHLAYVMYTSGSTGTPKGIQIRHSSLLDYVLTFKDHFNVNATDKVIQQSSLAFDTSVEEIFPALLSGATLIVMPDAAMDIQWIIQSIQREKATILSTTPLVLNELNAHADEIDNLRLIISGGDVLKPAYIDKLIDKHLLYNTYGPSESTVCITYNKVETLEDAAIIGRPFRNREVILLNATGGICPVGIKGELCVSGAGLANGYINNPAATKERFISHPCKPNEKMYRTGDLAKWLPDGRLEFLGRVDDQVKIRGFRIEPGEIENVLKELDGIKEAAILISGHGNDKSLIAFVVLSDDSLTITMIRKHLRKKLANYMIPSLIVKVDKIPYNSNGKTDRETLLKNVPAGSSINVSRRLPETTTQKCVAEIWKDLLNIPEIGLDDTFFDIGGYSLLLIKNNERIRKAFNIELPLNIFFYQTLEQIALEIDNKLSA